MKRYVTTVLAMILVLSVKAQASFDIFSYKAPPGFSVKEKQKFLHFEKNEGKNYCQLFLYPATAGQNSIKEDFLNNWNFFARNPDQQVNDPETEELDSLNGWQMIMGAARGSFNKQMFAITLSTFTKDRVTYYIASVFTDKKYIPIAQEFIASVVPDEKKFVHNESTLPWLKNKLVCLSLARFFSG